MNKKGKKIDPVVILLDVLIILLVFVTLGVGYNLFFYIQFAGRSTSFVQDASHMSFELSRNDYASLIQGRYMNEFNGRYEAEDYHALAEYVEALSQYKISVEKGYDGKAGEQSAIMKRSREEMGSLTIFADKADAMFGVADPR